MGHRGQKRGVRFDQQAVNRADLGRFPDFDRGFESNHPTEGERCPEVETAASLLGSSGEAVDDGVLRDAGGDEDIDSVVPCLAGMDHQGQAVAEGQSNLCGERGTLRVAR